MPLKQGPTFHGKLKKLREMEENGGKWRKWGEMGEIGGKFRKIEEMEEKRTLAAPG